MSYQENDVAALHDDTVVLQNEAKTGSKMSTNLTQPRSRPVRYHLISADGYRDGPYDSAQEAAKAAKRYWPDQEQDEDRTGNGWDVEVTI